MCTDFSIRTILGKGPEEREYDWLRCSRYRPPKLQRSRRKDSGRKKCSRTPRIPFTSGQLMALEQHFRNSPYLSNDEAAHLSSLLRLSDTRIKVWFQNRRARERRIKGLTEILPNKTPTKIGSGDIKNWSAFRPVQSIILPPYRQNQNVTTYTDIKKDSK